jgi:osmotically inducible protein OsmC
MPLRTADAAWNGDPLSGNGTLTTGSKAVSNAAYDWKGRSGEGAGTNPEELLAAAHAGCFSMALSHELAGAGHKPTSVKTTAKVSFDQVPGGFAVTKIDLVCQAQVPGIDDATFQKIAAGAKTGCPISTPQSVTRAPCLRYTR